MYRYLTVAWASSDAQRCFGVKGFFPEELAFPLRIFRGFVSVGLRNHLLGHMCTSRFHHNAGTVCCSFLQPYKIIWRACHALKNIYMYLAAAFFIASQNITAEWLQSSRLDGRMCLLPIDQHTVCRLRGGSKDVNDGRFCTRFIRMPRTCVCWCVAERGLCQDSLKWNVEVHRGVYCCEFQGHYISLYLSLAQQVNRLFPYQACPISMRKLGFPS